MARRTTLNSKLPWVRLVAEGVAIVLSILVAFAIDAAWDATQQERHLRRVLESLEAGLSESLSLIDNNIESVSGDLALLRRFVIHEPNGVKQIPADSTYATLESIWRPNTSDNNTTLLRSTLEDESLKLMEDPALQAGIIRWREDVNELDERSGLMAAAEQPALKALGRYPEIGRMMADFRWGATQGLIVSAAAMQAAREDPEVFAIASMKSFGMEVQLYYLRSLRTRSDSLLALVRSAQASR